ncbi:MAG: hypothetical protein LAO31_13525 [Acidobacteriia bacterium]|nr:hypothetical protein [Terriglobia bacterium]
MADEITLEVLFQLQDRAAKYNWENSLIVQKRLAFVSEAITLAATVLSSMRFYDHKQHSLRVLGTDAVSSIVTSVRVGLWGNLPESTALLRSALETSSILATLVVSQEYEAFTAELGTERMRRYSYKNAVSRLGDLGSKIDYLWGRLSNIGAHSTGTRMKFESYQLNGEAHDRLGAALELGTAELALYYAPDVCLHLLESFSTAYSQDSANFPEPERLTKLRASFRDDISRNVKSGLPDLVPQPTPAKGEGRS